MFAANPVFLFKHAFIPTLAMAVGLVDSWQLSRRVAIAQMCIPSVAEVTFDTNAEDAFENSSCGDAEVGGPSLAVLNYPTVTVGQRSAAVQITGGKPSGVSDSWSGFAVLGRHAVWRPDTQTLVQLDEHGKVLRSTPLCEEERGAQALYPFAVGTCMAAAALGSGGVLSLIAAISTIMGTVILCSDVAATTRLMRIVDNRPLRPTDWF